MSDLSAALADTPYTADLHDASRHSRDRFDLFRGGERVGRGTHFHGTRHIAPWLELQPAAVFTPDDPDHRALFAALADALAPGGHLMVHYLDDTATAAAITRDVPPPATPLGTLLWNAGCRWFKDWYFTEGWMEGDQKLQGNLPVDDDHRAERERETRTVLERFAADAAPGRCKTLADQLLDTL